MSYWTLIYSSTKLWCSWSGFFLYEIKLEDVHIKPCGCKWTLSTWGQARLSTKKLWMSDPQQQVVCPTEVPLLICTACYESCMYNLNWVQMGPGKPNSCLWVILLLPLMERRGSVALEESIAGGKEQNKETTASNCLAAFSAMFATGSAWTPAKSYICKS